MNQTQQTPFQNSPTADHDPQKIEITVNEQPVVLLGRRHTGLEIKQAAISQGVRIQLDFVLSIERAHGHTEIVGDNEEVTVTDRSRFVAICDDDNS
ncbi:MAG: multiubiquitin domain-containing protein [Tepidisphaeraceae bacterium]|jgi:hypothetical protein